MNHDVLEGKWKQVKGEIQKQWGKLTDDDLDYIAGSKERMAGKLQEQYGYARDEAHKKLDAWLDKVSFN